MTRVALVALVVLVLLALAAAPVQARHVHWHGGVYIGGPWFWDPFWYPPYYGWPPPYYAYPPPVVVEEPQVYVQRPALPSGYWYYCASARAYYPGVQTCPEPWVPVPPRVE